MADRWSFPSSQGPDQSTPSSGTSVTADRGTIPAGRVVIVIATCLLTWTLLDAPSLKRSSEAQPIGARRSASLFVLRPLAAISDVTRLGTVSGAIRRVAGDGGSAQATAPEPLPVGPAPTVVARPPSRTTPIQTPTENNRLRVVVVGDSLAQGLGSYLERVMRPALAVVSSQGVISSGLSRPDYYDWLHRMHHIENVFHPDLVIVMLGENDAQDLLTPEGRLDTQNGTAAWPISYGRRVQQLIKIAVNSGSHVVWVGLPIVQDHSRWDYIRRVDGIYEEVAEQIPNAAYLDTWPMFTTRDGRYAVYARVGGRIVQMREPDGIHFTPAGYTTIARAAIGVAEQTFSLSSKVTTPQ
jgi:hypothetical protein